MPFEKNFTHSWLSVFEHYLDWSDWSQGLRTNVMAIKGLQSVVQRNGSSLIKNRQQHFVVPWGWVRLDSGQIYMKIWKLRFKGKNCKGWTLTDTWILKWREKIGFVAPRFCYFLIVRFLVLEKMNCSIKCETLYKRNKYIETYGSSS